MTDLLAFLRARLDEDERVAQAAADNGATWRAGEPGIYPSDESRHPGPIVGGVWGDLEGQYGKHIARWDPARALAEVDAKRRVLDEHSPDRHGYCPVCDDNTVEAPCHTARCLALPYADHPDYRQEWRP